ncbi:MAG TPA: DUF3134 domain-containing protein [Candidatus Obscuribacterales bacterium]
MSNPQVPFSVMYNPSLRREHRHEPAAVIPIKQETSILDWLEDTGRLLARDDQEDSFLEDEEEITELMGVDDTVYDDLDDDDDDVIDLDE